MKQTKSRLEQTAEERAAFRRRLKMLTGGTGEKALFLDIETTGLFRLYDSVYLIGLLYEEDGDLFLEQLLACRPEEELLLLREAGRRMKEFSAAVTYNGESFDLPFLQTRADKLVLEDFRLPPRSLDLFRIFRPCGRWLGWPDMKLKTVESFLGIPREDVFSGGQLTGIYEEYARTGDRRLEQVLLLHNYEDVRNLPALLSIGEFWQGRGGRVKRACLEGNGLTFFLEQPMPFSAEVRRPRGLWSFREGSTTCRLNCELLSDTLDYYLPNYKDYYYLPESREIVHKSLAGSVPREKRRAAGREDCRLSRCGCFWPGTEGSCPGLRCYRRSCRDKAVYYETGELAAWLEQQKEEVLTQWFRTLWD